MQSKDNYTNQELLERGWTNMSERLDRELPQVSKWDLPLYFTTSVSILVIAMLSLTHQHDQPQQVTPLALVEQADQEVVLQNTQAQNTQADTNEETLSQEVSNQSILQSDKSLESQEAILSKTQKTKKENRKATQITETPQNFSRQSTPLLATSQTNRTTEQKSRPVIKLSGKHNPQEATTNAMVSIPINKSNLPTREISESRDKVKTQNSRTGGLTLLPRTPFWQIASLDLGVYFRLKKDMERRANAIKINKKRKLIPNLNVGYVYSFLAGSGVNVGFGMTHQLSEQSKFSLGYGLTYKHFGKVELSSLFNSSRNDLNSLGDSEINDEEVAANGTVDNQYSTKQFRTLITGGNQLALSISAGYRLRPRVSLGIGSTLLYQKFKTSSLMESIGLSEFNPQRDAEFDSLLESPYRVTLDLRASYHLTPRITLQPYWQIEPSKSKLRVNQIGIDFSFLLAQK